MDAKKTKAQKARENKNILIHDIVYELMENHYEAKDYIKCLLIEALSKRTQKELKQINA